MNPTMTDNSLGFNEINPTTTNHSLLSFNESNYDRAYLKF
jgi:hypothetical protein